LNEQPQLDLKDCWIAFVCGLQAFASKLGRVNSVLPATAVVNVELLVTEKRQQSDGNGAATLFAPVALKVVAQTIETTGYIALKSRQGAFSAAYGG